MLIRPTTDTRKTIFVHANGDTFRMEHTLVCTGRDRFSHAHKPVAIVSDVTRAHEQDQASLQENVPCVFGMTRWAAKTKYEIEFHAKYDRLDMPSAVY